MKQPPPVVATWWPWVKSFGKLSVRKFFCDTQTSTIGHWNVRIVWSRSTYRQRNGSVPTGHSWYQWLSVDRYGKDETCQRIDAHLPCRRSAWGRRCHHDQPADRKINNRIITARFIQLQVQESDSHTRVCPTQWEKRSRERTILPGVLQETLDKCNKNDIIIVMGYLIAKVGSDNSGFDRMMGVQGLGSQNENGEWLCEFCHTNGMVITGMLFPHKDIHKETWVWSDGRVWNLIDHLLISGQWISSVLDTRAQRWAGANSDYYLVKARLKLRLSAHKKKYSVKGRLHVEKRKDEKSV